MFSNHKRDNIWKHLDGKWKGLCCSTHVAHLGKPLARNGLSQKRASPAGLHWVGGSWIWLELRLNRHVCTHTHTHTHTHTQRHMNTYARSEAACMDLGLMHAGVSQGEGSPWTENDSSLPDPLALGAWSQPTPVCINANPLQCSCLGHPLDRGAWRATVHGFTRSQTCLSDQTTDNNWSLARGGSRIMWSEKAHILVVKVGGVGGTPKTRLSVPS